MVSVRLSTYIISINYTNKNRLYQKEPPYLYQGQRGIHIYVYICIYIYIRTTKLFELFDMKIKLTSLATTFLFSLPPTKASTGLFVLSQIHLFPSPEVFSYYFIITIHYLGPKERRGVDPLWWWMRLWITRQRISWEQIYHFTLKFLFFLTQPITINHLNAITCFYYLKDLYKNN